MQKLSIISLILICSCSPQEPAQQANQNIGEKAEYSSEPSRNNDASDLKPADPVTSFAQTAAEAQERTPSKPIEIDTELNMRLMPYMPANSSDATNGRLSELLNNHRKYCSENNASGLYSLFNQQTRFLFTKYSQDSLVSGFQVLCSDLMIGKLERSYASNELRIAPDGHTELGLDTFSLCPIEKMEGSTCRNGFEVSIEDQKLKWAWH